MTALIDKSMTELRSIAQALSIADIFQKSKVHLVQEIQQRGVELSPKSEPPPQIPVRILQAHEAETCDRALLLELLQPYVDRGLKVHITDEMWRFSYKAKTDSGTLKMQMRTALKKAHEIMT